MKNGIQKEGPIGER